MGPFSVLVTWPTNSSEQRGSYTEKGYRQPRDNPAATVKWSTPRGLVSRDQHGHHLFLLAQRHGRYDVMRKRSSWSSSFITNVILVKPYRF